MTNVEILEDESTTDRTSNLLTAIKLVAASALFYSAGTSFATTYHQLKHDSPSMAAGVASRASFEHGASPTNNAYTFRTVTQDGAHRRLSSAETPSYMEELMDDLKARKKLMEETPKEEIKYWFEYTGPLQVSHGLACALWIGGG
jgi:hypothetical protein